MSWLDDCKNAAAGWVFSVVTPLYRETLPKLGRELSDDESGEVDCVTSHVDDPRIATLEGQLADQHLMGQRQVKLIEEKDSMIERLELTIAGWKRGNECLSYEVERLKDALKAIRDCVSEETLGISLNSASQPIVTVDEKL